ncbi:glycosyltransferase [Flavobacteriaceae bacterium TP-CH-4]|uniref:Glycosyltransferase n=1 Tax=Pelagihabitans pacificus TaxID=2696054 RepID=A0A967AYD9_9FLAO|nr:glycosyltransferase [Pelagihabitans pacificus]NHF61390.1 glycosyltransferase [Pelagihabitans pacificus]
MIIETLEAIQKIRYPHTTYLCDEANDPFLKKECERLGVIHVTRDNRIDAKAGNINNALKMARGEICLILDPDHIPKPNFLDAVIPYFDDEKIGYVQTVQAYYNKPFTLVARGAAEQTFQFYGPMMMTMNTYGTVNAIGANCVFRRSALDSIGGHAPGLAEDMHTAMLLHAKGWESVYVPRILAKGLAPADLTSYYKQQLKWSRGTFELLYRVYPKIFKSLTFRQKIHYALLPLHYLIGFIYLLSFLIPVVSLFLSKMPWTGNIITFVLISLPVVLSSLLIRTYIQKWVIEKNERGFHVIGGLLQIIAWWVYILGVVYTFLRKKVPYLPTPKNEEEENNLNIVIPNLIVAAISLFAILYGLYQDFTPFSIIMSFFALLNALFMFFGVYLAFKVTNRNRILRTALENETIENLKRVKKTFGMFMDHLFTFTRRLAVPILLITIYFTNSSLKKIERNRWNYPQTEVDQKKTMKYLGIFNPTAANGVTDLRQTSLFERREQIKFDIISFYMAWGDEDKTLLKSDYLQKIKAQGSVPMLTWEPWASNFRISDSIPALKKEQSILYFIKEGYFDDYIKEVARIVKEFKEPFFVRFAHEFDNPFYPWSQSGGNTAKDFKQAWQHIHHIFKSLRADNVRWVWNPWKATAISDYYPGDNYVDWLGVNLLNYGTFNPDQKWYGFRDLYRPYHEGFKKISANKPVLLAEFGSLSTGGDQESWLKDAFIAIEDSFDDISGLVFFYSNLDKNIPAEYKASESTYLDWRFAPEILQGSSFVEKSARLNSVKPLPEALETKIVNKPIKLPLELSGIGYSKTTDWANNNYVASKQTLERDFKLMGKMGYNLVKCTPSPVYEYNLFKYGKKYGIKILYSFQIPASLDFQEDKDQLEVLSNTVISTVRRLKDKEQIAGWNFGNDPWNNASFKYDYSKALAQRKAYFSWLRELVSAIKQIDPKSWVTKDLVVSQLASLQLKELDSLDISLDAIELIVSDTTFLKESLEMAHSRRIPYIISGIDPELVSQQREHFANTPIIMSNWQNQWQNHLITYDGLLDFNGFKKKGFLLVEELKGNRLKIPSFPKVKILRPSTPLLSKKLLKYYALIHHDNGWSYLEDESGYEIEWRLAKRNRWGQVIALKKIGEGASINVEIPKSYKRYELVLTVIRNGWSTSTTATLNTPSSPSIAASGPD